MLSRFTSKNIGRLMLALGISLLVVAAGGIMLMQAAPFSITTPETTAATPEPSTTEKQAASQGSFAETSGAVARALPELPTQTPTPTRTPRPSPTSTATQTPFPTATPSLTPTSSVPTATIVQPTSVPIVWTQEEKNALSWLCYGEISGMGNSEYDACLSVISTVRARYAYSNNFSETDVISTLRRPNQFNVRIETSQPAPASRFLNYVEDYAQGARGSCNGYLYFNSIPGGPSACVIYGAAGLFIQFHNSF